MVPTARVPESNASEWVYPLMMNWLCNVLFLEKRRDLSKLDTVHKDWVGPIESEPIRR